MVLGSFNLTRDGLFRNREVLDHFCWQENDAPQSHILRQWLSFLKEQYLSRLQNSHASALKNIVELLEKRCSSWLAAAGADEENSALLTSGYGGAGLDALAALWRHWHADAQPDWALAVSPFFDVAPMHGCLADDIARAFPGLRELTIVTDETVQSALCKRHFGSLQGRFFRIPSTLSATEEGDIKKRAAERRISVDDQKYQRKLHAKILLLQSAQGGLLYLGSANFTRNAWRGKNCELGVALRLAPGEDPRESILRHLYVENIDRFAELPKERPLAEGTDDEPDEFHSAYPSGIAHIVFYSDEDSQNARFRIEEHSGQNLNLNEYAVSWETCALSFDGNHSQWLPADVWKPLLAQGRFLSFRPRKQPGSDKELIFWLPFAFDGHIVNLGEALILPTSLDWLLLHQVGEKILVYGGPGFNEGENLDNDFDDDIGRQKNRVIAMQHALSLFARVEERFARLVQQILNRHTAEEREHMLTSHVLRPLEAYAVLLHQESHQNLTDSIFKLGELALFICKLIRESPEAVDSLLPLTHRLEALLNSFQQDKSDPLRRRYITFVLGSLKPYRRHDDDASPGSAAYSPRFPDTNSLDSSDQKRRSHSRPIRRRP